MSLHSYKSGLRFEYAFWTSHQNWTDIEGLAKGVLCYDADMACNLNSTSLAVGLWAVHGCSIHLARSNRCCIIGCWVSSVSCSKASSELGAMISGPVKLPAACNKAF